MGERVIDVDEEDRQFFTKKYLDFFGKKPNLRELGNMVYLKQKLRLPNDDILWGILMSLENYDTLFSRQIGQAEEIARRTESLAKSIHMSAMLAKSDFTFVPNRYKKKAPLWMLTLFSTVTLKWTLIFTSLLIATLSLVKPSDAERIAEINGGADVFSTCFYGRGKIQVQPGGEVVCFPMDKGETFGFKIGETQSIRPKQD